MELDYSAIFEALSDAVSAAIPELICYDHKPDRPVCPAFMVAAADIEPNVAMKGRDSATLQCYVVVDRTGDPGASQKVLSSYLKRTGSGSVRAAIGGQRASGLGGLVGSLNITAIEGWREYQFGEIQTYGARIDVKIIG